METIRFELPARAQDNGWVLIADGHAAVTAELEGGQATEFHIGVTAPATNTSNYFTSSPRKMPVRPFSGLTQETKIWARSHGDFLATITVARQF